MMLETVKTVMLEHQLPLFPTKRKVLTNLLEIYTMPRSGNIGCVHYI